MITLTIPGEPVAKGRPRFFNNHAITPQKTVNYETLIKELFSINYPRHIPSERPLVLLLRAYFTIPQSWSKKKINAALAEELRPTKKPDIDNIIKCIDALNGMAFKDDSQIISVNAGKWYSDRPRMEIDIYEAEG